MQVVARLDENGTLRVVEKQTMVFTGDWNGGERRFDVRPRQGFQFEGMRRLDSTGVAHEMREGDLTVVDGYDFTDSRTLRWRSRLPSDPPFFFATISYELTYSYSNILVPDGDYWVLDHDFGFADRSGLIENFSVQLVELEPNWRPTGTFAGRWEGRNLPPGEGFVVRVPLQFVGTGSGPQVSLGSSLPERGILAVVTLLLLGSLARRLYTRENGNGRLQPLPSPDAVDEKWLAEHIFRHLPEVVGAAWDNTTDASEVAAILARLVSQGKMRSEVKPGSGWLKEPALHLEMLVDRSRFHGHERQIIDALFAGGETTTDTESVRKRYKKSGLDLASKIRKPLTDLAKGLVPGKDPSRPTLLPSLAAFLLAIALLVSAVVNEPADAPLVFGGGGLAFACYVIALGGATAWRNRVHKVGPMALFFIVPLGIALSALLFVVLSGVTLASTLTLAGLSCLFGALANSVLNQARARESSERIAFRRRLATARAYFVNELQREQPRMKDAWFPYLIAFGLGKQIDKWFHAFGGTSTTLARSTGYSSGSGGHESSSGGGWTGFGGGAGFSGGGTSASWAAAAGSLAAGVSAPSSSSGGSSGGGGGGGSSGGGGGGGW